MRHVDMIVLGGGRIRVRAITSQGETGDNGNIGFFVEHAMLTASSDARRRSAKDGTGDGDETPPSVTGTPSRLISARATYSDRILAPRAPTNSDAIPAATLGVPCS